LAHNHSFLFFHFPYAMPPRFYIPQPLLQDQSMILPEGSARHAQVLRLQPGDALILFNGAGGQWAARVQEMGRKTVQVVVGRHDAGEAMELTQQITLSVGMPANERMEFVIEKATELGAAAVQPLVCTRSVLRLSGERAVRKQAHWQAVAIAAAEQSGRTRVLQVLPVRTLSEWLGSLPAADTACEQRVVLSTQQAARLAQPGAQLQRLVALSGPEGGFTEEELRAAQQAGFNAVSLGARVLRADTAPLVVMAWWGLHAG
jgi:16S rRNA (uracil1498-N3)-methyltransferase